MSPRRALLPPARQPSPSLFLTQRAFVDSQLVGNIDASVDAVEEILGALLDISRLDAGAMKAEIVDFRIDELLRQLQHEVERCTRTLSAIL